MLLKSNYLTRCFILNKLLLVNIVLDDNERNVMLLKLASYVYRYYIKNNIVNDDKKNTIKMLT